MMVSTALRMLATIVSKVENREGQGWGARHIPCDAREHTVHVLFVHIGV